MKVAVLMGGTSFEREVSLKTGKRVCDALTQAGHEVMSLDLTEDLVPILRSEHPDVCYIAVHGKHGEDGTIQSLLDLLDIPYVGAPSSVCRTTRNKGLLNDRFEDNQELMGEEAAVAWPRGFCLSADAFKDMGAATALDLVVERIPGGFPMAVKPARCGSALGVHKVTCQEELAFAILDALTYDNDVVIQQWIEGVEISVSILGTGWDAYALPPVEIVPRDGHLFLAEERMVVDAVDYYAPVRPESLSADPAEAEAIRAEIERVALEVYRTFNMRDLGRIDLVWDGAQARILELDVSPGLTEQSLFPAACQAAGLTLSAVLDRLVTQYA